MDAKIGQRQSWYKTTIATFVVIESKYYCNISKFISLESILPIIFPSEKISFPFYTSAKCVICNTYVFHCLVCTHSHCIDFSSLHTARTSIL